MRSDRNAWRAWKAYLSFGRETASEGLRAFTPAWIISTSSSVKGKGLYSMRSMSAVVNDAFMTPVSEWRLIPCRMCVTS